MKPKQVQVRLSIPFLGEISCLWEPEEAEQRAAWELYVELVTRIAVVRLGPEEGLLREALSSLYELFPITRDILRRYGPAVAPKNKECAVSFGFLAVALLNGALRPLLSTWHPTLLAHEAARPADVSPAEHERAWKRAAQLRADLEETRVMIVQVARILGEVAGAAWLLPEGAPSPDQTP